MTWINARLVDGVSIAAVPRSLSLITAAPHRVFFLPGALQGVLAMLYWLAILAGRAGLAWSIDEPWLPAGAVHAWLLLYGLFPFFVFGFLFTAVPNWLETAPPERRRYLAAALAMVTGVALFYAGLSWPGLAALGVALHLAGWAMAVGTLYRLLRASPRAAAPARPALGVLAPAIDRRHARAALLTCGLGAAGEAAFLFWLLAELPAALVLSEALGVWGFLLPLFLTVCHRMLPWFTGRVVQGYAMFRPGAALWGMLVGCTLHVALEVMGLDRWLWLSDAPLAILLFWLAWRWYTPQALRVRLLAMLHLAFPWAGLACALYAADSLLLWMDAGSGLGHAPLHALGVGFFASMLLAMASRVSLGHSGRKLEADRLTWVLFWFVQLAALLRVLPDLFPSMPHAAGMLVAALAWLAAFAPWAWRYAPFYWRPRIDGKPG